MGDAGAEGGAVVGNSMCLYGIVILPFIVVVIFGLIYIFKKDWAWSWTEMMLKTVKPQRTPEWERYSTINGVILLVFGMAILLFILIKIGSGG